MKKYIEKIRNYNLKPISENKTKNSGKNFSLSLLQH